MDKCYEHAKMLVECEYVKEIVGSIDFNPKEKTYIHKVGDKNLIEVRLQKTKLGYGLRVLTTAENRIQNHWIAKYLNDRYGK